MALLFCQEDVVLRVIYRREQCAAEEAVTAPYDGDEHEAGGMDEPTTELAPGAAISDAGAEDEAGYGYGV